MARKAKPKPVSVTRWVILVGADYGAFIFEGSEAAAEELRRYMAQREHAVALKRPVSPKETTFNVYRCWNHPFFEHGGTYYCNCDGCLKKRLKMEK